jgi:hypothetical protein
MKQTLHAVLFLVMAALAAAAHAQPVFNYDPNLSAGGSHVFGNAALVARPPASFYDTADTTIGANYVQLGGVHDWGNEAVDGATAALGAVAASSDAFITFDGDGTNEIRVRFSSDALLDSSPPTQPAGYGGRAEARNDYALSTAMNGLTPGQPYVIQYSWSIIAAAGFPAAGGPGNVCALAEGSLDAFVIGFSTDPIFARSVLGLAGQAIVQITPSGSGVLPFTPTAASNDFALSAKSFSGALFEGPADFDDLVGATFYAEATFKIVAVPEPATLTVSAIAFLFVARRRRLT